MLGRGFRLAVVDGAGVVRGTTVGVLCIAPQQPKPLSRRVLSCMLRSKFSSLYHRACSFLWMTSSATTQRSQWNQRVNISPRKTTGKCTNRSTSNWYPDRANCAKALASSSTSQHSRMGSCGLTRRTAPCRWLAESIVETGLSSTGGRTCSLSRKNFASTPGRQSSSSGLFGDAEGELALALGKPPALAGVLWRWLGGLNMISPSTISTSRPPSWPISVSSDEVIESSSDEEEIALASTGHMSCGSVLFSQDEKCKPTCCGNFSSCHSPCLLEKVCSFHRRAPPARHGAAMPRIVYAHVLLRLISGSSLVSVKSMQYDAHSRILSAVQCKYFVFDTLPRCGRAHSSNGTCSGASSLVSIRSSISEPSSSCPPKNSKVNAKGAPSSSLAMAIS
mmetsp:Transcript_77085/g.208226  ORF Transcript_77085/g.208226 Transcript_77085/m.208226 type:complete len:392 (-) Transcript_77085:909-2084(-)